MTVIDCAILPVADVGVMLKFADVISDAVQATVLAADAAVKHAGIRGVTETVPSYTSLYVGYDPLITDFACISNSLRQMSLELNDDPEDIETWEVPVCYEQPYSPDLPALSSKLGLEPEAVIDAHLSGDYRVAMYGFAPGYAYLRGVPEQLQVPRKLAPITDVPAGSVIVAGPQCLVTTLVMPTGWWIIGRSPFAFLRQSEATQFPVAVGSRIQFKRISAIDLGAKGADLGG